MALACLLAMVVGWRGWPCALAAVADDEAFVGVAGDGNLHLQPPSGGKVKVGEVDLEGTLTSLQQELAATKERLTAAERLLRRPSPFGPNLWQDPLMKTQTNLGVTRRNFQTSPECASLAIEFSFQHRYNDCFSSKYMGNPLPNTTASSCSAANQTHPFFFGNYHTGRRLNMVPFDSQPTILRMTGYQPGSYRGRPKYRADDPEDTAYFGARTMDVNSFCFHISPPIRSDVNVNLAGEVFFRAWIKVVEGSGLVLGQYGNCLDAKPPNPCGVYVDPAAHVQDNGWFFADVIVPISLTSGHLRLFPVGSNTPETGGNSNFSGRFDLLMALPFVSATSSSGAWFGS